jgi:hypothetical protein
MNDIFRTVRELLENRDCVLMGNAVNNDGKLYDDSVDNLHALDMLEPSLRGLVDVCVASGMECAELYEVIGLLGLEGEQP